jgi:hypothetical protein
LDSQLDAFLRNLIPQDADPEESDGVPKEETIFLRFYYAILSAATQMLETCVEQLMLTYRLAIRSQGLSYFVLNMVESLQTVPTEIECVLGTYSFKLPVLILGQWEYIDWLRAQECGG